MDFLQNFHVKFKGNGAAPRNPDPSRPDAAPALAVYMAAFEGYQKQRTVESGAALFQSYRRWIGAFLDDANEADRAATNFLIALRNQPPESREAA